MIKEKRNLIYAVLLSAIAATLPLKPSINSIFIILLVLFWVFEGGWKEKFYRFKTNLPLVLLVGFFFLNFLGLAYSSNFAIGIKEIETKLSLLVLPMVIGSSISIQSIYYDRVINLFVFSCIVTGAICLGFAFYQNYLEGFDFERIYSGIVHNKYKDTVYPYVNNYYFTYDFLTRPLKIHPIYYSMFFNFSLAALVMRNSLFNQYPILRTIFLIFIFILILLLSSRTQTGITFFLIPTILVFDFLRTRKKSFLLINMALIFTLGFFIISQNRIIKTRIYEALDFSSDYKTNLYGGRSLRVEKWKCALLVVKDNLLIGTGTGDENEALYQKYKETGLTIALKEKYNAHNQFLQTLMAQGLLGLVLLLSIFYFTIKYGLRRRNFMLVVFTLIFFISCSTESMFLTQKGAVFFSFFASLLLRRSEPEAE
jgi:hypothetical protein